jgi:hypothetical protein
VTAELESQLRATRVKFDAWRAQVDAVDTSLDLSFKQRSAEVRLDIKKGSDLCAKIHSTVANAQQHREKFPHIDDREMALRQTIVDRLDGVSGLVGLVGCLAGPTWLLLSGVHPHARAHAHAHAPLSLHSLPTPSPAASGSWHTGCALT